MKNIKNNSENFKYRNGGLEELFVIDEIEEGNIQLPSIPLLNVFKERKNRVLWINKEVADDLQEEIKCIIQLNREDAGKPIEERKPCVCIISSPGGDLYSMYAFIDVVAMSKTPIWTINLNYAFSASALMLLAGHKRFCLKNSSLLFHNGSGSSGGNFNEMQEMNKSWQNMVKRMQEYIIERTNIPKQTLTKKLKSDWILSAKEQLEYGCVDEILEDIDVILNLSK